MKKIVLVGAGHSHLEVILALTREQIRKYQIVLISPDVKTYYSGSIPRVISGDLRVEQLIIPSADYAISKGIKYIRASVSFANLNDKLLILDNGDEIKYDLLSINVGGSAAKILSESPEQTIYLRPFSVFIERWKEVQQVCASLKNPQFVVVGGGAAAFEIAVALKNRLLKYRSAQGHVHIVTRSERLCESYSRQISLALLKSAQSLGISVHFLENVRRIEKSLIALRDGSKLSFDYVFVSTQIEANKIKLISDLVETKNGFPQVNSYLKMAEDVFGSGDGVVLKDQDLLPKSGVVAVHEGRYLYKAIFASARGLKHKEFTVPGRLLNILTTGDNRARAIWGDCSIEGQWVGNIKNWIDASYVKKFLINSDSPDRS